MVAKWNGAVSSLVDQCLLSLPSQPLSLMSPADWQGLSPGERITQGTAQCPSQGGNPQSSRFHSQWPQCRTTHGHAISRIMAELQATINATLERPHRCYVPILPAPFTGNLNLRNLLPDSMFLTIRYNCKDIFFKTFSTPPPTPLKFLLPYFVSCWTWATIQYALPFSNGKLDNWLK